MEGTGTSIGYRYDTGTDESPRPTAINRDQAAIKMIQVQGGLSRVPPTIMQLLYWFTISKCKKMTERLLQVLRGE